MNKRILSPISCAIGVVLTVAAYYTFPLLAVHPLVAENVLGIDLADSGVLYFALALASLVVLRLVALLLGNSYALSAGVCGMLGVLGFKTLFSVLTLPLTTLVPCFLLAALLMGLGYTFYKLNNEPNNEA